MLVKHCALYLILISSQPISLIPNPKWKDNYFMDQSRQGYTTLTPPNILKCRTGTCKYHTGFPIPAPVQVKLQPLTLSPASSWVIKLRLLSTKICTFGRYAWFKISIYQHSQNLKRLYITLDNFKIPVESLFSPRLLVSPVNLSGCSYQCKCCDGQKPPNYL